MNYQRVKEISEQSKREKWPTPTTFEMLKAAGITSYRFNVSAYETVFTGTDGTNFAEPAAGVSRIDIAPVLDVSAVVTAIRRHIKKRTAFLDFRGEAALAGVQYWNVDMKARTCTYVGMDGSRHEENVPILPA